MQDPNITSNSTVNTPKVQEGLNTTRDSTSKSVEKLLTEFLDFLKNRGIPDKNLNDIKEFLNSKDIYSLIPELLSFLEGKGYDKEKIFESYINPAVINKLFVTDGHQRSLDKYWMNILLKTEDPYYLTIILDELMGSNELSLTDQERIELIKSIYEMLNKSWDDLGFWAITQYIKIFGDVVSFPKILSDTFENLNKLSDKELCDLINDNQLAYDLSRFLSAINVEIDSKKYSDLLLIINHINLDNLKPSKKDEVENLKSKIEELINKDRSESSKDSECAQHEEVKNSAPLNSLVDIDATLNSEDPNVLMDFLESLNNEGISQLDGEKLDNVLKNAYESFKNLKIVGWHNIFEYRRFFSRIEKKENIYNYLKELIEGLDIIEMKKLWGEDPIEIINFLSSLPDGILMGNNTFYDLQKAHIFLPLIKCINKFDLKPEEHKRFFDSIIESKDLDLLYPLLDSIGLFEGLSDEDYIELYCSLYNDNGLSNITEDNKEELIVKWIKNKLYGDRTGRRQGFIKLISYTSYWKKHRNEIYSILKLKGDWDVILDHYANHFDALLPEDKAFTELFQGPDNIRRLIRTHLPLFSCNDGNRERIMKILDLREHDSEDLYSILKCYYQSFKHPRQ